MGNDEGRAAVITGRRAPSERIVPSGCLTCGLLTGALSSSLFTPFDRALYLSVTARRPLFDRRNWERPFQGLLNTFVSRAVNTGLYYPLESIFANVLSSICSSSPFLNALRAQQHASLGAPGQAGARQLQEAAAGEPHEAVKDSGSSPPTSKWIFLASGQLVGLTTALVCHPMNMVKCASWSNHAETSSGAFFKSLRIGAAAVSHAGPQLLYRGLGPTLWREVTFGGVFSVLRHEWGAARGDATSWSSTETLEAPGAPPASCFSKATLLDILSPFGANFLAASAGVLLSSPFNYARNMQLATPLARPTPSTWGSLRDLWRDAFRPAPAAEHENPVARDVCGAGTPAQASCRARKLLGSSSQASRADLPRDIQKKALEFFVHHPTVRGLVALNDRLRIGWGTGRACLGITIGAIAYDACMIHLITPGC
ncbi:carrier superfamily protein [Besnoitia besnoiti]|uniref:Carrier superfamily protein n=1 Tax=Besnoitia besnoiti TaxID=94643 RepID=A0A2A9M9B1_BESBE|nr:carrier superfamily protein [Besnoitia besnoiti]PFH32901.1 carrier superfamily protein [Besnoitia besnoiti]